MWVADAQLVSSFEGKNSEEKFYVVSIGEHMHGENEFEAAKMCVVDASAFVCV